MYLLKTVAVSFGSIVALFIFTKLIGNKQMSELNMFDYINGITIGSIAAEMATSLDENFMVPLVAMTVYTAVALLITLMTNKSLALRRIITGGAIILVDNGKMFKKNFTRARLDINEFLAQCRINGFFDLSDIQTAILEANGHVSILAKATARPVCPSDLDMNPQADKLVVNVIQDGKIIKGNLKYCGHDEKWLKKTLRNQGFKSEKDVFLATCDSSDCVSIYRRDTVAPMRDLFQ